MASFGLWFFKFKFTQSFTRGRRPLQLSTNFRTLSRPAPEHSQANWIGFDIHCPTGQDNYLGIGATVIITAGTHTQAQIIDGGGGGYASQTELTRLFGLGTYSGTVDVVIKWPCGDTTDYDDLAINEYHEIIYAPLVDDTTPSFSMEYDGVTENYKWIWTWETSEIGDGSKDVVDITDVSTPGCLPTRTKFEATANGIDHDVSETAQGNYLHTLAWTNADCEASCLIYYKVTSGVNSYTNVSTEHRFRITACIGD